MTIRPVQPTFAGGEYSPSIYPRVDIAKYQIGLKRLRNFIIHPTGGASNRPGTRYVATAKYSDRLCIVQEFVFSRDQKYILEIGHEYIRFYTNGARINVDATLDEIVSWNGATAYSVGDYVTYNGSTVYYSIQDGTNKEPGVETDYWTEQTIYEIPTPYQEEDLYGLRFEPSADVIWITHPDYSTKTLSRFGLTDWRLEEYFPEDGPFMLENIDESISLSVTSVTGSATLNATAAVFSDSHVGSIWKLRHYIEGQTYDASLTATGAGTGIKCFTTWRLVTHGTWTAKFNVEKSTDGGVTWTILRAFSGVNDLNVNTSGTEDIEANPDPFLVRINVTSYTSGTLNVTFTTDAFYQDGIVQIDVVNAGNSADVTVLKEVGLTTETISWSEGSWSDFRGWPSVARFFQDRLVFGGTYSEPMTLWMTQTGNYYSFLRHTTLLDTDAIITNIPSRQVNIINGLVAFKRLLVLTSSSIWSIGPVSGSGMTPTGFTTEIEIYNGSNGINPLVIGNEAIYIQEHGHIVSNIGFELSSDSFAGSDANILAQHLFDRWTILDMAYQRNPDRIIWMLRSDGHLVGMTYMKEQEVVAFHEHDTGYLTGDQFESLCVIPSDGFDEVWFSVNRENGRFIERMVFRNEVVTCDGGLNFGSSEQVFMDSTISYYNQEATINSTSVVDGENIITLPSGNMFSVGDSVFIPCNGKAELACFVGSGGEGGEPDPGTLDVALALLVDVSSSIDSAEYALQVNGYAAAFRDQEVINAIENLTNGKIAVCVIMWASAPSQKVMIPWMIIDDSASGESLALMFDDLAVFNITDGGVLERPFFGQTATGSAINFSIPFFSDFATLGYTSVSKKVMDISTDGIKNTGDDVPTARDSAIAAGININALAIQDPAIVTHLENDAITPGGFVNFVSDFPDFAEAIKEKILLELCNPNTFILSDPDFEGAVSGEVVRLQNLDGYSGLDHLEGQLVTVAGDGEALGTYIVASGAITLNNAASTVHVGLPYLSDLETLNIEVPLPDGTAQGRKIKISQVTFRLLNSRGGYIGPNEDKLYEAFTTLQLTSAVQLSAPIGPTNAKLFNVDIRRVLGAGYEGGGRVFYRQVDPLPVTIGAIIPEVTIPNPTVK